MHNNRFKISLLFTTLFALTLIFTACSPKGEKEGSVKNKDDTTSITKKEELVVRLCFDVADSTPYQLGEGTDLNDPPGINIELFQAVAKKAKIKIEFNRVPWNRGLSLLKTDDVDAIFQSSFKESRKEFGAYPMRTDGTVDDSRNICKMTYSFYKLKDSPFDWNGQNVSNLDGKVGVVHGYSVIDDLKKLGVDYDESNNMRSNFDKLLNRRIGAYAQITIDADAFLKANPSTKKFVTKLTIPIKEKSYYLMFSKHFYSRHPGVAESFWDGIKNIRNSDQYKQIYNKYSKTGM